MKYILSNQVFRERLVSPYWAMAQNLHDPSSHFRVNYQRNFMIKQLQDLLRKKEYRTALEVLKTKSVSATLMLVDYDNENHFRDVMGTSDEEWDVYLSDMLIRLKQISEEEEQEPLPDEVRQTGNKTVYRSGRKVFISYSRKDEAVVNAITGRLLNSYYDFFIDTVAMTPGEMIEERITKEILDRDCFVILLSANSLQSPWVSFESAVGHMLNTTGKGTVIPVRLDDSLEDFAFLGTIPHIINDKIAEFDEWIKESKKISKSHKYLDTPRQQYVDFLHNYDSMIDRYRKTSNITLAGNRFESGIKELVSIIQKQA